MIGHSSLQPAQFMCGFIIPMLMAGSRKRAGQELDMIFGGISQMSYSVVATGASEIPGTSTVHDAVFPEGPPTRIQLSKEFSWARAREKYIDAVSFCVDAAESHGLRFALEPRPREMVSNTDGLISLFKEIGSSNFGALVDTAHLFVQRESIPLSLHKLGGRIFGVHLADSDGLIEHHWAPGEGKIDWEETLRALSTVRYEGILTVQSFPLMGDPEEEFLQAKAFLEDVMMTLH